MSPTHDRALKETVVDSCEESFGLVPATPPNWSRRFFSGELNGASEFSAAVALDDSRRIRSGDRGVFGVVWVRVEVKVCSIHIGLPCPLHKVPSLEYVLWHL